MPAPGCAYSPHCCQARPSASGVAFLRMSSLPPSSLALLMPEMKEKHERPSNPECETELTEHTDTPEVYPQRGP